MEMRTDKSKDARGAATAASKASVNRKQPGAQTGPPPSEGSTGEKKGEQAFMQQAKEATGEIVNQVQQKAGSQLTRQKESAVMDLSTVVNAVRKFGENLSQEADGPIARYAAEYGDKAADKLERFAAYVRKQDPKQLLQDVQKFGRRQPVLLLGGMFLLGFAGARLIKSSMEAGSQQQSPSAM